MAPSIRHYGVAVDKVSVWYAVVMQISWRVALCEPGVHFGKHGALILTFRSYVEETKKHKQEAVRNSRKNNQARKKAQKAAKAAVLGSQTQATRWIEITLLIL